jgi:hypothetical protein
MYRLECIHQNLRACVSVLYGFPKVFVKGIDCDLTLIGYDLTLIDYLCSRMVIVCHKERTGEIDREMTVSEKWECGSDELWFL